MHNAISDAEFANFRDFAYQKAGISLSDAKKGLVCGRLAKRLKHYGLDSYGDYFKIIKSGQNPEEIQTALDLLTTNETYFFREPKHFDFLKNSILAGRKPGAAFRVWCAASSSGEEPYTLAMVLSEGLGDSQWEIVASDISTRVLEKARNGLYPMERASGIPAHHLKAHCLKGVGSQEGMFLIGKRLRSRVSFRQINLVETLPDIGTFDVVFIRNVMIYFDMETKRQVVKRIMPLVKPGGYLVISHSESLNGISNDFESVAPSIYRRP